jgi:dihydrofolate reductase
MKLILIMAMTADGKIGRTTAHFPDWTCSQDKRMFKKVSQEAGVVIMGSRTFDTIGKALPGRLNVVMTRRPDQYQDGENLVFWSGSAQALLDDLKNRNYKTAVLAGGATINSLFAGAGLIDEILLTIAPKLFGQGLSLFSAPLDLDLELKAVDRLQSQTILLTYQIKYTDLPDARASGQKHSEKGKHGTDSL